MLQDTVVLVTNVTNFAGLPAAREMASQGATVLAHDSGLTDSEARNSFQAETPGVTALSEQEPVALVEEAMAVGGRIDVLVNNDIGDAKRAKVEDAQADDMRQALEDMVVAPYALTGAVVPSMKERKRGKIIFVTSATPLRGLPNYSMYVTARGATNAMTLTLAHELAGYNIQVNALAPNYVESPAYFPEELIEDPETLAKITKNIPLGRLAKPEEVGKVLAFMASDASNFITGHVLPYAGGWA